MNLQKAVNVSKRYLFKEFNELSKLREDVLEIETLLTKVQVDQKLRFLEQHYETKIRKEERVLERIERRLNRWIEILERKLDEQEEKLPPKDKPVLENLKKQIGIHRGKLVRILADGGELYKLITQKSDWKKIENKIDEALGTAGEPGIRSLLLLLNDVEHHEPSKEVLVIDGVRIPPGFSQLRDWPIPDSTSKENIRWLNERMPFIFEPTNPKYLAYLERCKEDTKSLEKYLHHEASKRGLPIWLKRRGSKRDYRKMNFLIRPPYFSSNVQKDESIRMQRSEDSDNFILHYDQNHTLQEVRYWVSKVDHKVTIFRAVITEELGKNKFFLSNNYGHWNLMAVKIIDLIETNLPILTRK